jgi:hypothetical protein
MNRNPSLDDRPPYQFNYNHRGLTLHWNGTDHLELYEKHLAKSSTRNLLEHLGWIDSVITYSYNSHGFRCKEFDDRPSGLALGCSFTEGTGLFLEQTWPSILSTMLNTHIWNLGTGGASIDTVFRILDHYIKRLNPKFIFILVPPESRFEYCTFDNGFPVIQALNLGPHESFAKEWLSQPLNGRYNTKKTMLAIEQICEKANVPLFVLPSYDGAVGTDGSARYGRVDLARDLQHPGILYQKYVADVMNSQIQNFKLSNNE